ncbi:tyrosine-type recombinase/integrase [Mangrovimonas futianensis]|uniref:tyrosine-type recombinase/integrase n=1 Tax=Mangrovimonas futianensis TaxID=2895523 RepID=UPI001E2AC5FA|nr:tyrosine-type recombinase/integrase [Mangrovimonas futianensis]MCF1421043.1 site-specific integrase [Mangrovimonas futianensis]
MSAIKFYPSKQTGKCKIYLRVILNQKQDFRLSTGLSIENAKDWNNKTNRAKKTTSTNKNLNKDLNRLEGNIEDYIDEVKRDTKRSSFDITSKAIKNVILITFNEKNNSLEDLNLLIPFAKRFAKNLKTQTYTRNGVKFKYSPKTIEKYTIFAKHLENYQKSKRSKFKVSDVNTSFLDNFLEFLPSDGVKSINELGRYAKRLKTIIKDAEEKGIRIDSDYRKIKGFEDETLVTFLTFEELDKIIETDMPNSKLQTAKDWLIIGSYTALRISDMFRVTSKNITDYNGNKYISLKQFKTKKNVYIPIHYKVDEVLQSYNYNFPPNLLENEKSNRAILSKLMKKVCELAKINEKVVGRLNGVKGTYEKHKLISNHSCRRSFASNFYGLEGFTTSMIMEITGHENERNFLKYIDKRDMTMNERMASNFALMKEKDRAKTNKPTLKKVGN